MWWTDLAAMGDALATLDARVDVKADVSVQATLCGAVHVGAGSRICAGAHIHGPVWIGRDCLVGNGALLRGPLRIGDGTRIGFASELKHSLIGRGVSIGPQCFIGDSRIDDHAYLGALVRTSNHRLDGATIKVHADGAVIDSQRDKLGAWIGTRAALGVGVIILPGRIVAAGSQFGPRITVERNLPPGRYRLLQHLQSQPLEHHPCD
ncbi:TPA: acetyltransferase [Stenotrophomonas maltophilia]|nr:acetyltransferase [Stenotrophomonas maltophilia]HDS1024806.1 acetyltransferase [Stenotrophomonas maltophilia]HDS1028850.1 acetyltransferase [Stenotrophomonas maltophilia]HDS1032972.1 acetyltransferase [Stenotrophomonas maltophilia]